MSSVDGDPRFPGDSFEVNFLPELKHLHDAGYNILTYDLRNCGLSGEANGGISGLGLLECRDVASRPRSFLEYLEKERGCSGATRNLRLAAIHSLAKFIPIWKRTADMLKLLVAGRNTQEFVFLNRDEPLTRFGIYSLVRRAVDTSTRASAK